MAKDRKHTKPENWVSLQEIYTAERARFLLPARPKDLGDYVTDPVLQVVRNKLKRQPHRYLDRDGVRHENDLSYDFIDRSDFNLDGNSASLHGRVIRSKSVHTSIAALMSCDGEWFDKTVFHTRTGGPSACDEAGHHIDEQAAEASRKQPALMGRNWIMCPAHPQCAMSYEDVFPRWDAYAIELLEVPEVVAIAPAPLPKPARPISNEHLVIDEIRRRMATGEPLPHGGALDRKLAQWTTGLAQKGVIKRALGPATIRNYRSKARL
jgi:hypothetical protein